MEERIVGGWLEVVGVGLLMGCCWQGWLVWAAGGVGASKAIEGVGELWAALGSC